MRKLVFKVSMLTILLGGLLTGCSGDADTGNIEAFEGTFVGKYRALIYDTDNDTMTVTVDAENNKVYFASAILGTSFETNYDPSTNRATIVNLMIDTIKFVQGQAVNYAYNTTVGSGYCEMKNNETELYVQLNNCVIEDHTIDLLQNVKPLTIPLVNTPNNMDAL